MFPCNECAKIIIQVCLFAGSHDVRVAAYCDTVKFTPTLAYMLTFILFSRCIRKFLTMHAARIYLGLTSAFAFAYLTEILRTSPTNVWLLNLRNLSPC